MSIETQDKTKKNTQANASLILGLISIVFALFNYAPGFFSVLGIVGVVAALLAILAGVRGLRAAREIEEQGRKLAIAGIAAGGLGLLLFIITFIAPVTRNVREMETLLIPQPPQTFQGDGFTLTYPGGWEEVDAGQDWCNKQPGSECILAILHPSGDGTNIVLIRFALEEETTLEAYDQASWAGIESEIPDVNLESRDIIEIGGQPAIRRVFSLSTPDMPSGRGHFLQVILVKGLAAYYFMGTTISADTSTQYRAEIEEIITSIQFSP